MSVTPGSRAATGAPRARVAPARVAGSDTREAMATPTVRFASLGAALAAGPGWAAAFSAHAAFGAELGVRGTGAWLTPLLLAAGVAAGVVVWRLGGGAAARALPPAGSAALIVTAGLGIVTAAALDARLAAVALPILPFVGGYAVARAALMAARASVPDVRIASAGVVTAFGLGGFVPGLHIILVGAGAGLPRASGWSAAYLLMGAVALGRARALLAADVDRIAVRSRVVEASDPVDDGHALALRGVSVRFGPNRILDGATLSVPAGRLVALVGGNGAGKSTLLRAAAGFVVQEAGQISVAGEDVSSLRPEERAAVGLSFVSGARPVFPDLTVMQNLRVAAYRTHKTPASFAQAAEALLELVPTLAARREDRAGVLSGGEQRLLAVAQTLFRRPAVLLADELTLGLDVDARTAVMDLLVVLAREGVAVVAVDHDLPSLLPRADQAALLVDGAIETFDDPAELLVRRTDLLPATFLAGVEG